MTDPNWTDVLTAVTTAIAAAGTLGTLIFALRMQRQQSSRLSAIEEQSHREQAKRIAVFLDRDGTINIEKEYLYQATDFEFIPGTAEAIRLLNQAGILVPGRPSAIVR